MTENIYKIRVPIVVDAFYFAKAEDEKTARAYVRELIETDSLEMEGRACYAFRGKESTDAEMFSTWEVSEVLAEQVDEIVAYYFEPDSDYDLDNSEDYFGYEDDYSEEDVSEGWYYDW